MIRYFKKENNLAKIVLVFEGSNVESQEELGLTHLMEHLVCKKLDYLQYEFNKNSILFNAETTNTSTIYYINGLDSKVKKFSNIFIKKLTNQKFPFTKEEIENEKRIVIQELEEEVNDDEAYNLKRFYHQNGLATPIGLISVIKKASYQQLKTFFKKYHKNPTMCLIENNGSWKIKNTIKFKEFCESEILYSIDNKKTKFSPLSGPQENIAFSTSEYNDQHSEHLIIQEMLCGFLFSPLLKKIREDLQLTYHINYNILFLNENSAHSLFSFNVNKNKKVLAKEEFLKIINNPKKWMTKKYFKQTVNKISLNFQIAKASESEDASPALFFLNSNVIKMNTKCNKVKFKNVEKIYNKYYKNNLLIFN
jgi:predicted Zn-dependent peptidase